MFSCCFFGMFSPVNENDFGVEYDAFRAMFFTLSVVRGIDVHP